MGTDFLPSERLNCISQNIRPEIKIVCISCIKLIHTTYQHLSRKDTQFIYNQAQ